MVDSVPFGVMTSLAFLAAYFSMRPTPCFYPAWCASVMCVLVVWYCHVCTVVLTLFNAYFGRLEVCLYSPVNYG